jgi:hypothetical protein
MAETRTPTNFWSRRRAAVEAETAAEIAAREAVEAAKAKQAIEAAQAEQTDTEILLELGLKEPEEMAMGDDFAAFMRSEVPERLRSRALRVLWRSNPVLANLDGLLDHDDDFTDAATVMPNMKTTYQIGKGMLHHVQALAREAEMRANPIDLTTELPGDEVLQAISEDPVQDEPVAMQAEIGAEPDETEAPVSEADEQDQLAMPRRHMRFVFAENAGGELR